MADFIRITLGLLFAFNVIVLVIFTATRWVGHEPVGMLLVIAVNILADAVLFYVLF